VEVLNFIPVRKPPCKLEYGLPTDIEPVLYVCFHYCSRVLNPPKK